MSINLSSIKHSIQNGFTWARVQTGRLANGAVVTFNKSLNYVQHNPRGAVGFLAAANMGFSVLAIKIALFVKEKNFFAEKKNKEILQNLSLFGIVGSVMTVLNIATIKLMKLPVHPAVAVGVAVGSFAVTTLIAIGIAGVRNKEEEAGEEN